MDTTDSSFPNFGRGSLSEDKMYFLPSLGEKGSFLLLLFAVNTNRHRQRKFIVSLISLNKGPGKGYPVRKKSLKNV